MAFGSEVTVHSRLNWNLETFIVVRREENWRTLRKTLEQGRLHPHMASTLGITPGPCWSGASALINAPSLILTLCFHAHKFLCLTLHNCNLNFIHSRVMIMRHYIMQELHCNFQKSTILALPLEDLL